MKFNFSKKEALRIIIKAAQFYEEKLEGKNYLFIYRDQQTNKLACFETVFLPRNFQHLTGVDFLDDEGNVRKNAVYFYHSCLNNTITEKQIRFRTDGTTQLKLAILPQVIHFLQYAKMTNIYNGARPKLAVERLVGTTNYSLGFVKDGRYYVPSTCLLEDVRKLGDKPSRILAIFSKKASCAERQYKELCYVAKGVPLHRLELPEEIKDKIIIQKDDA